MRIGDYPTSSDVKCYINGWWVDDLHRIEWEEHNPKIPLYGYHQKLIGDVADGRYLVAGNIILHFRYPFYLSKAIQSVMGGPVVTETKKENLRLNELIDQIRKASPLERVRLLAQTDPTTSRYVSDLLIAAFEEPAEVDPSPVLLGPSDDWFGAMGFDMTVVYGQTNEMGVTLTGMHLTGARKVVSASPGGGDLSGSGQSLLVVYPFFCRSLSWSVNPDALRSPVDTKRMSQIAP